LIKEKQTDIKSLETKGRFNMPASLLYHTNQITDVQVKNTEYFSDKLIFHVTFNPKTSLCPCCKSDKHSKKGVKYRQLHMAPLGNKQAVLSVEIHRLICSDCLQIWWPKMPFVRGKKRVTLSFERYVVEMMRFATIEHVAKFLRVSWGLVKDIHKAHLKREYKTPDLSVVRYIGVDEFSIRKGHEYMTIFINLESGEIIHAVEGKSIDSVKPFMIKLGLEASNLKAIAMDMNAAYASAVKQFVPGVDVVYDRFHVMALMNEALEDIRRSQQNRCDAVGLKTLKGCRFLLLTNYDNLSPGKLERLNALMEANKPLAIAHAMKEQMRLFWMKHTIGEGAAFLCHWVMDAVDAGIYELRRLALTILRHGEDMVKFFRHKITNGKTEGINNKIKTMKRQAYGFRDMDYFKLRLYNLHKTRYSFV
jgi:transposase